MAINIYNQSCLDALSEDYAYWARTQLEGETRSVLVDGEVFHYTIIAEGVRVCREVPCDTKTTWTRDMSFIEFKEYISRVFSRSDSVSLF